MSHVVTAKGYTLSPDEKGSVIFLFKDSTGLWSHVFGFHGETSHNRSRSIEVLTERNYVNQEHVLSIKLKAGGKIVARFEVSPAEEF